MTVGFAITLSNSGVLHHFLAPANANALTVSVTTDLAARQGAIVLGRLHYRKELPGQVALEQQDDARRVLRAYQAAGSTGIEALEGEFAVVVWDLASRQLFLARDPFGSWPLFWAANPAGVSASTDLRWLAEQQPGGARVDREFVGSFLVSPTGVGEMPGGRTAFRGVNRVPAGDIVGLVPGAAPRRIRQWDWFANVERIETTRTDAAERLRHLLDVAVAERMPERGATAAHNSGGMDSSAVVCLGRNHVASGRSNGPIHGLTLTYEQSGLAGERAYSDLVIEAGGSVVARPIAADGLLDYDWFSRPLPAHAEPYAGLPQLGMELASVAEASRAGCRVLLTGLGSDEILDRNPFHLADLLRRGRWVTATREAVSWARGRGVNVWSILRNFGIEPAWPVTMQEGWLAGLFGCRGRWPRVSAFSTPDWVLPDFSHEARMKETCRAFEARARLHSVERSVDDHSLQSATGDWANWHLAAPQDVCFSHPFRDPRLVRFCLGLPRRVKSDPSRRKPLLQDAMVGVLPELIRTRNNKRGLSQPYWQGLSRNLPHLERMVRSDSARELGTFDGDRLVEVLRSVALGVGGPQACDRLDRSLCVLAWYEGLRTLRPAQLEEKGATEWSGDTGRPAVERLACVPVC